MASPAQQSSLIRFGAFQLNAATGELCKAGRPVKIHPQPFRVLLLLAERSGQIVTREEIRHCLWGDNTVVEFEGGINFCVRQIRAALGDDAENPRYLQTLPRRGYRFIASTTFVEPAEDSILSVPPPGTAAEPALPPSDETELAVGHETRDSPSPLLRSILSHWNTRVGGATVLLFLLVAVLVAVTRRQFHRPALTEKDSIVLADFTNTTSDAMFDDALKQALAMELGQSPFLNVLPDTKVREALKMMGRAPGNQRITVDVARELCVRTGSKALIEGRISTLGSHYLVSVNAVACSGGDTIANEQVEAANKESVLQALSQAAFRLRSKLGESLPSLQTFDVPVQATTASLEALKELGMGNKVAQEQGDAPSIPFYQRAIELDPNFSLAYAGLAARYNNLDQPSLALVSATKAYELRDPEMPTHTPAWV